MGMALVMPTKLEKTVLPRTAASLQRAFRTPNAVALRNRDINKTWALEDHFIKTETSSITCILKFSEGPFCQKLPEYEGTSKTVGGKTALTAKTALSLKLLL